jgi:starch-binding outer membrane protein, SusD/RagB family
MEKYIYVLVILIGLISCLDGEWLEQKRDIKLIVPQTLSDLRLLLNDDDNISSDNMNLAELSSDDYYLPQENFDLLFPFLVNLHTWNPIVYPDDITPVVDWDGAFSNILLANVVLEQIEKIQPSSSEQLEWNEVKGAALFLRGKTMYFLVQQFCKPYNAATASVDWGIPIRRNADSSEPIFRASVQETYDFIRSDLTLATQLLRDLPEKITDPSKAAAFAFLSRLALIQGEYAIALEQADKCLALKSDLLDFNLIDSTGFYMPDPRLNPEIIQYSKMSLSYSPYNYGASRVPDDLYLSYADDDLRKTIWFIDMETGDKGSHSYKGSYTGARRPFTGITTAEMFLVRAECKARLKDYAGALDDINGLLEKRYKSGTFKPVEWTPDELLSNVLVERRKELLRRGMRWTDVRRVNEFDVDKITLVRVINGVEILLPPGDQRYTLPIPSYLVKFNNMQQNPR